MLDWHRDLHRWVDSFPKPLVVGINGPQGCGKSTLAAALVEASRGWVAVSIDDFYLTRAEQIALAERFTDDPLMQVRGGPGTHDIALGVATLDALAGRSGVARVPVYDKSAHGGKGDRAGWREVALPVEVVVFEGWMLGFDIPGYEGWTSRLGAMIQLRVGDPRVVVEWRVEAERRMRELRGSGMSDDETVAYISRFLPFYDTYPARLEANPPVPGQHRVVVIGRDRARIVGPSI